MTTRQRIDDLTKFAVPEQPALSPDGGSILYVLRTVDAGADRNRHAIWRVGTRTGEAEQLTRGDADSAPAWSPDGTRVAFLRAQDGPAQLWLLPAAGGEPTRLTTLPLGAGAPVWSPDGTRIAFGAAVDTHAADGEDEAVRTRRAKAPVVADRLDYQADGAGLLRTKRKHLHVLDVATGQVRQVTEGDWHAGDPSWSPDGTRLAFAAATAPDADLRVSVPVHVLDLADPAAGPRQAGLADGVAGPVGWTADGQHLLVVGGVDGPVGHARLLRLPLDGGPVVDLAAGLDRNVMAGGPGYPGAVPRLVDGGRTVLFCVRDRGCTHLYAVDADGGTPRPVVAGAGLNVSGMTVAGDTAAVVLGTPTSYGEVVTVDPVTGARVVSAVLSCMDTASDAWIASDGQADM
ncbi:serine hydrolase, partial [Catellatospora sp. NPDC049133]